MSDSGYESDKVQSSATAVKSPVITKFDQSNRTMAPKSSVITKFETRRPRKEFAPDRQRPIISRQQPIMSRQQPITSRERLVMTHNYVPKFERNGNYVSRSTALYKPSMASLTALQQVMSVSLTDKKCAYGYSQHCHCSTEPSYVNTSARGKVVLPRSNLYPDARRIGMDQSEGRIHYRAARTFFGQSQPHMHTATDQPEGSNPGSFYYKRRCHSQLVSPVSPRTESSTVRNTLSSIGYRVELQQSNTPVRRQSTTRVNYLSNKPVRCLAPGIDHRSNTPDRWKPIAGANYRSNSPVRRQGARPSQLSNTPVRHQPSSPNSTSMYLLRCLWSTYRMRRRQTRRRRFQKSNLMCALYVATQLWNLPLIGSICYRFIGWMWSGLLWYTTTTSTRASEPNSADN